MRLIDADALKAELKEYPENQLDETARIKMVWRAAISAVDDAPTFNGWISVKDRLPEENLEYLVCVIDEDGERYVTTDHWNKYAQKWCLFDNNSSTIITHWMLFPEVPKEEE